MEKENFERVLKIGSNYITFFIFFASSMDHNFYSYSIKFVHQPKG